MAEIIEFKTRERRQQEALDTLKAETDVLTGLELYHKLLEESYETLDFLITKYKQTGKWNPTANMLMRRVFDNTNAVCAAIAGVKNGTPAQDQAIGTAVVNIPIRRDKPAVNTAAFFGGTGGDGRDANGFDNKRRDDGGGFDGPSAG